MGSQFTCYLGLLDQQKVENAIRASGDIAFLTAIQLSSIAQECASSVIVDPMKEPSRILIARREDISTIAFRPIKGRSEYSCDVASQLVIEFDRYFRVQSVVRPGRMYRVDNYWNDSNLRTRKPDGFVAWGQVLFRKVKQSLQKIDSSCYAGEQAIEMREAGVPFEGLDVPLANL